ncbi:MAG: hypothetical protein R6V19_13270 [Armatimonadota bacterium]
MKKSLRKGFSFGLTSGVITTLGLLIGLHSSTHSAKAVLGGIIVIAIADGLSDALGIHVSEEAEAVHTDREIWAATLSTFVGKFVVAMSFAVPFVVLSLGTAVIVSLVWGFVLIGSLSAYMAIKQEMQPLWVVLEHLGIAVAVVIITHYVGHWVGQYPG